MPKIPTFTAQTRPTVRPPAAPLDLSEEKRLAGTIGRTAGVVMDIRSKFLDAQARDEASRAIADAERTVVEQLLTLENEDYREIPKKYEEIKRQAYDKALKHVSLQSAKDLFDRDFADLTLKKDVEVKRLARKKQIDQSRADLAVAVDALKQDFVATSDETSFKKALEILEESKNKGIISAEEFIKRKNKLKQDFLSAKIDYDIQTNPKDAVDKLEQGLYGLKRYDKKLWAQKINSAKSELEQFYRQNNRLLMSKYLAGELDQIEVSRALNEGIIQPQQANQWIQRLRFQFDNFRVEPSFYLDLVKSAIEDDPDEFAPKAVTMVDLRQIPFTDLSKLDTVNKLDADTKELLKSKINAVIAEDMPDQDRVQAVRRLIDRFISDPQDKSLKRLNPEHEINVQWKKLEQDLENAASQRTPSQRDFMTDLSVILHKKQEGQTLDDKEFGDGLILPAIDNLNFHITRLSAQAASDNVDPKQKKRVVKAIRNLEETRDLLVEAFRDKDKNFFGGLVEGMAETATDISNISFIGGVVGVKQSADMISILNKVKDGKPLDAYEKSVLAKEIARQIYTLDLKGSSKLGKNVGSIIVQAAYFIPEFIALTGTVGASAETFLLRGLTKAQQKAFGKLFPVAVNRFIAQSMGTAIAGMANVPRVSETAAKYMIPDYVLIPDAEKYIDIMGGGDGVFKAISKALGTQAAEFFTETLGGYFDEPMKVVGRGLLRRTFFKHRLWRLEAPAVKRFLKAAQFNNPLGEALEEEVNGLIQQKIDGQPFAPLTSRAGIERFMTNTLAFTLLGGVFTSASITEQALRRVRIKVNEKEMKIEEEEIKPEKTKPNEDEPPPDQGGGGNITVTEPPGTPGPVEQKSPGKGQVDIRETPARKQIEQKLAQQKSGKAQQVFVEGFDEPVDTQYAVVDVSDLVFSHDAQGVENPVFKQVASDLQPKDRYGKTSIQQILKIGRNINPELLGLSNTADTGAPIIGVDGIVEAGNARAAAIELAYKEGNAGRYKQFVLDQAQRLGIPKDVVASIENPVLVRVRKTPLSQALRRLFAEKSNAPRTSALSPSEQAKQDAKLLPEHIVGNLGDIVNKDLTDQENVGFLKDFAEQFPVKEQGKFFTKDGRPTKHLVERARNALFAKAYGDPTIIEQFAEETSPVSINLLKGLAGGVKPLIQARLLSKDLNGIPLDQYVVSAVKLVFQSKQQGVSIRQLVSQIDLFDEPVQSDVVEIAKFLKRNIRAPRKIAHALNNAFDALRKEISLTKLATGDLFGRKPVGLKDLVDIILTGIEPKTEQREALDQIKPVSLDHYLWARKEIQDKHVPEHRVLQMVLSRKVDYDKAIDFFTRISKKLGVKIRLKEFSQAGLRGVAGENAFGESYIRVSSINNLVTLFHELGHQIDFKLFSRVNSQASIVNRLTGRRLSPATAELNNTLTKQMIEASKLVRRDFDERTDRRYADYRKDPAELMADFFVLYTFMPKKAYETAPDVYKLYDKAIKSSGLGGIFDEFKHSVNEHEISFFKPEQEPLLKKAVEKTIGWIEQMSAEPVDGVKDQRQKQLVKKNFDTVFRDFVQPMWVAENNPLFRPFYEIVRDYGIYEHNHIVAQLLRRSRIKEYASLPEHSKSIIAQAVYEANSKAFQKLDIFTDTNAIKEEYLRNTHGMTDEEIKHYRYIALSVRLAAMNYYKSILIQAGVEISPVDNIETVSAKAAEMGLPSFDEFFSQTKGYFPIMRFGDTAVYAKDKSRQENVFMLFENDAEAVKYANWLKEFGYTDVSISDVHKLPKSFFKTANLSMVDLLMLGHVLGWNETELRNAMSSVLGKTRLRFRLPRKFVPGYMQTPDNLIQSLAAFFELSSRAYTKQLVKSYTAPLLADLRKFHKDKPDLYDYAASYIDNFYSASADKFIAVRRVIYSWYLAFKTSFLVQNLTQPAVMTYPQLLQQFGLKTANNVFFSSYKKTAELLKYKYMPEGKKPVLSIEDANLMAFLDELEEKGVISGQFTNYLLGIRKPVVSKIDTALSLFGVMSEKINRFHAAISFIEAYKHNHNGDIPDIKDVERFVEITQGAYGAYNIPQILEGSGKLRGAAHVWFVFKSFMLHYLSWMATNVRQGNYKAVASSVAASFGLAGIYGLPAFMTISALITFITQENFDEKLIKFIEDMTDNDTLTIFAHAGLAGLAGISPTLFALGDILYPRNDPLETVLGIPYSFVKRTGRGVKYLFDGEVYRGVENLSPAFVSALVRALRLSNEGLRKISDKELLYEPTIRDIVVQALGFTPYNVNLVYTEQDAKRLVAERSDKIRQKFEKRLVDLYLRQIKASRNGDKEQVVDIIKETADVLAQIREYNQTVPPEFQVRIGSDTISKKISEAVQGRKGFKGVRKQLRPRFVEIEQRIRRIMK